MTDNLPAAPESLCPTCDSIAVARSERRTVMYGKYGVEIDDSYMECPECGETFYAAGQARAAEQAASLEARRQYQMLSFEYRSLRRLLGLTQEDIQVLLGYGEKQWTRLERGLSMADGPAVLALRLLQRFPALIRYVRALHGPLAEPEVVAEHASGYALPPQQWAAQGPQRNHYSNPVEIAGSLPLKLLYDPLALDEGGRFRTANEGSPNVVGLPSTLGTQTYPFQ